MRFDAEVCIDFSKMTTDSVIRLLNDLRKDPDVTSIVFTGALYFGCLHSVIEGLIYLLLNRNDRCWKKILFQVTTSDWSKQCVDYKGWGRLEATAQELDIPLAIVRPQCPGQNGCSQNN
jgi:hypothetical protein